LSYDTKAIDLDRSSTVDVTGLLTFLIKVLISSILVVEAYKGLTEAPLPLMADALATKSVLQTSVQSWLSRKSIP